MVYSGGPSVKVAGEILHRDRVRDTRSVSRMIQSGSHKIITGAGINPSDVNQNDLYSPTNIIAIGGDRVTVESTLKRGSKIYTLGSVELPFPWKRYGILDKRPDTAG